MVVQYFADLDVWKRSRALVIDVYAIARSLPRSEGTNLGRQMRRAVVSISSNIAEGAGRSGRRDFARFLDMAVGSASELESQFIVCSDLGFANPERVASIRSECVEIRSMLRGLRRAVLSATSDS